MQTRLEIARPHDRLKSAMIYVTRDQVEAMTLANKIVVLHNGQIEQVGAPVQVYHTPENAFFAQFIGNPKMKFFIYTDLKKPTTTVCTTGIQPEHLTLADSDTSQIEGHLELVEQLGEYALAHLITPLGAKFMVKLPTPTLDQIGKTLWFNALPEVTHHFDTDNGQ